MQALQCFEQKVVSIFFPRKWLQNSFFNWMVSKWSLLDMFSIILIKNARRAHLKTPLVEHLLLQDHSSWLAENIWERLSLRKLKERGKVEFKKIKREGKLWGRDWYKSEEVYIVYKLCRLLCLITRQQIVVAEFSVYWFPLLAATNCHYFIS